DSLPGAPEWVLINIILASLSVFACVWSRLLLAPPLLFFGVASGLVAGTARASRVHFSARTRFSCLRLKALTAFLHLHQPLARLWGRWTYEAGFWRRYRTAGLRLPLPCRFRFWTEQRWEASEWLNMIAMVVLAVRGVMPTWVE